MVRNWSNTYVSKRTYNYMPFIFILPNFTINMPNFHYYQVVKSQYSIGNLVS